MKMWMIPRCAVFISLFCLVYSGSCSGRCGSRVDRSKDCQCNTNCATYNDCCSDYQSSCTSGSDITTIANQLWQNDMNYASSRLYTLDYQGRTSSSSTTDRASRRLFRYFNETALLSRPTYSKFKRLLDNYDHRVGNTEYLTSAERREIDQFLDAILSTDVMRRTERFLRNNGKLSGGRSAFKTLLNKVWFKLYRRSSRGPISSSGFEHVFVGETKSSQVSGFHNWIQFYLEEKAGRLDYKGYVYHKEPNLIGVQFSWHLGMRKSTASFFVGTSPEFDMAIYTICFLMKPGAACRFKISGYDVALKTYDNSNWTGQQVATAYPM